VTAQNPLELIQARNLLSSISTAGMLVSGPGDVIFYNEAASALLGQRFEETGTLSAQDWVNAYGPFDDDGEPIPLEDQALTVALRANRPGHAVYRIRSAAGDERQIEASGIPIIGKDGFTGALILFWAAGEDGA
jgi:PAS domain-containing protein